MAETIFEVDVKDESFKRFQAEFDKYKKAVIGLPGAWANVEKAISDTAAGTRGQIASVEKMTSTLEKTTAQQHNYKRAILETALAWSSVAHWTKMAGVEAEKSLAHYGKIGGLVGGIAGGIGGIAGIVGTAINVGWNIGWGSLSTLGKGLLGGGGLWGISALASGAGAVRRSSLGLGLLPGELRSAEVNYQKMFDARSVAGSISSIRNDPDRRWALTSMGLNPSDSTSDLLAQAPGRAKQIYEEGGQSLSYAKARGLLEMFSEEDLQRLHNMTVQEIEDARRRAEADKRQMAVADDLAKMWQSLSTQFNRAATFIETTFLKMLGPLAPELEKLSDAFTEAVKTALSLDFMRLAINALADGIRYSGEYISSAKFLDDIKSFGSAVESVWHAVSRVARWINGLFSGETIAPTAGTIGVGPAGVPYRQDSRTPATPGYQVADFANPEEQQARYRRWAFAGVPDVDRIGRRVGTEGYDPVSAAEVRYQLPQGLLDRMWQQESARGTQMGPSSAGARGHFQFMPATGAQYGLSYNPTFGRDDFSDLSKSSGAAGRYMSDLLTQFRGDLAKATAAYNWGPANVQRAVDAHGDQWRDFAPQETRRYLEHVVDPIVAELRAGRRSQQPVVLRVENPAGAQVAVTGAAVRAQ